MQSSWLFPSVLELILIKLCSLLGEGSHERRRNILGGFCSIPNPLRPKAQSLPLWVSPCCCSWPCLHSLQRLNGILVIWIIWFRRFLFEPPDLCFTRAGSERMLFLLCVTAQEAAGATERSLLCIWSCLGDGSEEFFSFMK